MSATLMDEGWVDVHAHFMVPQSRDQLHASWQARCARCFMTKEPFEWTVEGTLDYMDRNGIAMQMLSAIPKTLEALQASNDHGADIVARQPTRFGLLAALPTDNPDAALAEIARSEDVLQADGFAVTCNYNGIYLGDPSLDRVWAELDHCRAVVFMHPDAYAGPSMGRPSALLEVAFETARTVVDMVYAALFRRFPNIRFVVAHCGGALPAVSGRLMLLGAEEWVPNPHGLTREDIRDQLASLYFDTAATATEHTLGPALAITSYDHIVYGSDCGVPCSTEETMLRNRQALLGSRLLDRSQVQFIGRNALNLFPRAAARLSTVGRRAIA